ncbi:rhodanese-like domain-containing protein [uncultured Adlercreutzia sp.]|uniref:rhodanese-like domain-containing protein n=1 Tax=uncultured Adlercreutzia sp. TaxID=875803 RepID=UPI002676237D|nr:rhodanese-like domain-containing protein [uncultured Adlercreutzia sp.]
MKRPSSPSITLHSLAVASLLAACLLALPATLLGCGSPAASEPEAAESAPNEQEEAGAPQNSEPTPEDSAPEGLDPYAFGSEEPVPASNLLSADEFEEAVARGDGTAVDVRTPATYAAMQFPWECLNIPVNQLGIREREFADAPALLIAGTDNEESARAFAALLEIGYPAERISVLDGGMNGWLAQGRDIVVPKLTYGC